MSKTLRITLAVSFPILILAIAVGCNLISGQITIVHPFDDDTGVADTPVYALSMDLNDNEDYKEHGDKIKSLEAFGFVVEITNRGNMPAKGEGYLSLVDIGDMADHPDSVAADPNTTLVVFVKDPLAPGATRNITFEESQDYIEGFDKIEEAIMNGKFYFYGITDIGQDVRWEDLKLVATLNVEL
jgi:hypothetical protein